MLSREPQRQRAYRRTFEDFKAFHTLNICKLGKMHEIASTVTLKMRLYPRESKQFVGGRGWLL